MSSEVSSRRPARPTLRRLTTIGGAVVAALAVWVAAAPVTGVPLTVRTAGAGSPETVVGPVAVALTAVAAGLAGWALLAVLERFLRRARTVWTVIACAVLAVSLLGPLGGAVGAATLGTLLAMHLVVGVVLIVGLPSAARAR